MRARRLLLTPLGIAVLPVLLSGCIIVTAPRPIDTSVPSGADGQTAPPSAPSAPGPPTSSTGAAPPATPTDAVECGEGGSPTVEGNEKTFRVTGTCAALTVVGAGLTVDAASATIGTLRIAGDRISARFAEADAVVVEGDDAALTSEAGIGSLEIDGDRSVTEARTGIPSVAVRGRDNTVRSGGGVGSAVVTGSGNSIR